MRRRTFLMSGAGLALTGARGDPLRDAIERLERETGGRIGLVIHDTGSGRRFGHRATEPFPMCSTFKWLLAAAVMLRVDRGQDYLNRVLAVTPRDIIDHAPFAETRVGGTATIAELCRAAVALSDNTAANLLLPAIGGPAGLTHALRQLGDSHTRLDRNEPSLNEALRGDPRDTTTPEAMTADLRAILLGRWLSAGSRKTLTEWMLGCETGSAKLRVGLPKTWRLAEKTGAGERGSDNDVAMLLPPGRKPILVASYLTGSTRSHAELAAVHARIGALIAAF